MRAILSSVLVAFGAAASLQGAQGKVDTIPETPLPGGVGDAVRVISSPDIPGCAYYHNHFTIIFDLGLGETERLAHAESQGWQLWENSTGHYIIAPVDSDTTWTGFEERLESLNADPLLLAARPVPFSGPCQTVLVGPPKPEASPS